MEQRFTQPSKRVLRYARDAARRMGHNYVGTEHILIGLLLEKEGEGGKILRRLGLTDGNVMRVIEGVVGIGTAVTDNPVLTTKTRLAMEEASREATKQSRPIETDIILWGLLQQEDSMAVHVLENMDIDTAGVIEEIEEGVPARQGGEETPDTDTGTKKENPPRPLRARFK